MITVHKQILDLKDAQSISAPDRAEFIHVTSQRGEICVWYRCDLANATKIYDVIICGTGHPAPTVEYRHIGTILTDDQNFVWHIFVYGPQR